MKTPSVWLSVDFDFFIEERPEYDWSHTESRFFHSTVWEMRYADFVSRGVDVKKAMSPARGDPPASRFWDRLVQFGFDLNGASLVVADSHMFGALAFPLAKLYRARVLNFDAHHDMGYRAPKELQKVVRAGNVDCSDWLLHTLEQYRSVTAKVVYPKWRGLDEDKGASWKKMRVKEQFSATVFDDADLQQEAGPVAGVFVARSGSWVPPWFDTEFVEFVRHAERVTGQHAATPFVRRDLGNPLVPRVFDEGKARESGEALRRFRKQMLAMPAEALSP